MQTFNVKNVDNSLSSYIYIIHVFVVQNNLVLTKTNVIFNPLKQILHSVSTPDQEQQPGACGDSWGSSKLFTLNYPLSPQHASYCQSRKLLHNGKLQKLPNAKKKHILSLLTRLGPINRVGSPKSSQRNLDIYNLPWEEKHVCIVMTCTYKISQTGADGESYNDINPFSHLEKIKLSPITYTYKRESEFTDWIFMCWATRKSLAVPSSSKMKYGSISGLF